MPVKSRQFWSVGRILLSAGMVFAGTMHFVYNGAFAKIVPPAFGHAQALVLISGFFEIAGGVGLLIPRLARLAAAGVTLLLIAVFPANIYMAVTNMEIAGHHYPLVLWLRLPLQLPLIAWAYLYTRNERVR